MYLHRIIDIEPTATSPSLITHKQHVIKTHFTDLCVAVGEEVKEALWMRQHEVAAALIEWHKAIIDTPIHLTADNPLVTHWNGQTITFRLDHTDLKGDGIPTAEPEPYRIEDTCCGKCDGGTCYVDQITGA